MEFTINRKDFIDALVIGGAMSTRKNTIPILEYAKVRVDERQIVVSSSDSEVYVTKRAFVKSCTEEKEFCISSVDLLRALKSIDEEDVNVKMDGKTLKISHKYGKMKFPYLSAEDFPTMIKADNIVEVKTDCERLFNLIDKARDFIDGKRETAIAGMYLFIRGNHGGVCGTDGHKLFFDVFPVLSDGRERGSIIPVSSIPYILNTINGNEKVSVVFEGRNITFKVPNARINCRVMDLNYPPFEKIIPVDNNNNVRVELCSLKSSVNRTKMFSSSKGGTLLNVDISEGNMDIVARDYEENKEGSESVSVSHSGDNISLGLNGAILSQCLSAVESDSVTIKIKDGEHGILFGDDNNPDRVIMQMPIVRK